MMKQLSYQLFRFTSAEIALLRSGHWLPEKTDTYAKAKKEMDLWKLKLVSSGKCHADGMEGALTTTREGVSYQIFGRLTETEEERINSLLFVKRRNSVPVSYTRGYA